MISFLMYINITLHLVGDNVLKGRCCYFVMVKVEGNGEKKIDRVRRYLRERKILMPEDVRGKIADLGQKIPVIEEWLQESTYYGGDYVRHSAPIDVKYLEIGDCHLAAVRWDTMSSSYSVDDRRDKVSFYQAVSVYLDRPGRELERVSAVGGKVASDLSDDIDRGCLAKTFSGYDWLELDRVLVPDYRENTGIWVAQGNSGSNTCFSDTYMYIGKPRENHDDLRKDKHPASQLSQLKQFRTHSDRWIQDYGGLDRIEKEIELALALLKDRSEKLSGIR